MIVDAHAHIFPHVRGECGEGKVVGLSYGKVSCGQRQIQLFPPAQEDVQFTPEMLIANMDWAGVERAVLLQGPFYGECNEYALDAVRRYPKRLMAAAYLDPWDENCRASFESTIASGAFRAVKLECSVASGLCGIHRGARLDDKALDWLWPQLERRGLVLVLDLGAIGSASYQTDAVRRIAPRHGELKIVIAHLGQPSTTVEMDSNLWRLWEEQIDLGRLANVWFDNSALPHYLPGEQFPYPSAGRYLRMAIERTGPAKILFGTDIPGVLAYGNYAQLVRLTREHVAFLPPAEKSMIMGGNAVTVFG